MIRRLSLILSLLALTGCATSSQTAPEGTPLVPLSVQAVAVAPTPRSIATPSGLQSAYNAVAKAEPNMPDGTHPNRSSPVSITGTIILTQPIRVPGNAVTIPAAGTNQAQITYMGTDAPIVLYSAVGNGATDGVHFKGVNIYAPNSKEGLWKWDATTHTGDAHDFTVEDCSLTDNAGPHINLNAPGNNGHGRCYNFIFRNIDIYGAGPIAQNDANHSGPIVTFDNIRAVNRQFTAPAFDLYSISGEIRNCWIELHSTTVLSLKGSYCTLRWTNNYIEPHGAPASGEVVHVEGPGVSLLADAIYFVMPVQHVATSRGGQVFLTGPPDCQNADGAHLDWTQPLEACVDLLKSCFVTTDAQSAIAWPGGRIDARGVFKSNATTPTTQASQTVPATQPAE